MSATVGQLAQEAAEPGAPDGAAAERADGEPAAPERATAERADGERAAPERDTDAAQPVATVITCSDSAADGRAEDTSGPLAAELLGALGIEVTDVRVVSDDEAAIAAAVRAAIADGAHIVVTTGGTGAGPRDVTPEALHAMGLRELPGFGEAIRAASRAQVPAADLSRALGGILDGAAVLALPGSPGGVRDGLGGGGWAAGARRGGGVGRRPCLTTPPRPHLPSRHFPATSIRFTKWSESMTLPRCHAVRCHNRGVAAAGVAGDTTAAARVAAAEVAAAGVAAAGGAAAGAAPRGLRGLGLVRGAPITEAEVAAVVARAGAGAVVTFAGVVRDHDRGRQVTALHYEAHPDASRELAQVVAQAGARPGSSPLRRCTGWATSGSGSWRSSPP